ncbi:nucleoside diphosphate kinase 6-like [Aphelocoma coerulescens]|uniref:nucleoside diphosphate kinase 6-like n=1 Tax=Aphelocoma coerulescens TaxID=39617 RepID=UPI0036047A3F
MWAYILAHENAVPLWRSLMGPTKVFRARHSDPDSIRGAYGLTDTRNTTHGSDSPASASREIAFFFPEFDEQHWYEQDEPQLRCGQLYYSAEERVHRVLRAEEAEVQSRGSAGHHCCPCPQQCPEWICSGSCVSSQRSESCCPQCC